MSSPPGRARPPGTLDVVNDLADSGIVDTKRVGRSVVVTLNQVATTDANSLRRCLDLKTKAAYETRDLSAKDAAAMVRHATQLVEAAEKALLAAP